MQTRCRLPNGASVSLADRPQLWSILVAFHELGGTATKEQLVQAIWHEAEYQHAAAMDRALSDGLARRDTMVTPPATAVGPAATYRGAEAPCK